MKRFAAAGAIALSATAATAGGVDRSEQSIAILFEAGKYVELSFRNVNPSVSGTPNPGFGTQSSGDLALSYSFATFGLKMRVSDKIDVALIYDQPYGANVEYPFPRDYFATGSTAELNSHALTKIARYKFSDNISVYGGARYQSFDAMATIPFLSYSGSTDTSYDFGYLVGAAYEKPEIALRVALTYYSKITHNLTATETSALGADRMSPLTVQTPQAVNLDVQTGVAPGTLVFGGVRWVNWSNFDISPDDYGTVTGGASLVAFANDTWTYTIGAGRQLNEHISVGGSLVYEPSTGEPKSNLNPTDGRFAAGMAVTYTDGPLKLRTGLQHIWIGDATTNVGAAPAGVFTGNTAWAFGTSVGLRF